MKDKQILLCSGPRNPEVIDISLCLTISKGPHTINIF